jgi:hypothetical protein
MAGTKLARLISCLFHPLLIPLYILILLLNLRSVMVFTLPIRFKFTMAGVVLLTTVVSPLFLTWMMQRLRIINSVYMAWREERLYPILAVSVFYYLTYFLLKGVHVSVIFSYYMLGASLLAIMTLLINFRYKISLHAAGIGSTAGLFIGISLNFGVNLIPETCTSLLLAGIVGWARLKNESHTPVEIYLGFLLGTIVMTLLTALI